MFALPAVKTIDTFGRRNLLLTTFPLMSLFLLMTGFAFWIPSNNKAHLAIITLGIYLFSMVYSPGEGPVPFTVSTLALAFSLTWHTYAELTNLFFQCASILRKHFRCIFVRSACRLRQLQRGSSTSLCRSLSRVYLAHSNLKVHSGGMQHGSTSFFNKSNKNFRLTISFLSTLLSFIALSGFS